MASVRYMIDDVDAAAAFYVERLGFEVEMRPGPGFAALSRRGPAAPAQPARRGRRANRCPTAAGQDRRWNRIQIEVADLQREVDALARPGSASAARS